MIDKDLIKKYKLEEDIKRFGLINEYIYEKFDEADGGEEPQEDTGDDTQDGNMDDTGGDIDMDMTPGDDAEMDMDISNDMADGDDMNMDDMMGDPSSEGMPEGDADMDMSDDTNTGDGEMTEPMQDGDEVIDVDDLTNSQEQMDYKIDGVDDKLAQLLQVIDKFQGALADNDEKIADLKHELEVRNPTPTERLNLRSQSGCPYNVSPKDFWGEKGKDAVQYEIDFGNDDVTDPNEREEYVLKKSDIENGNDRDISDSFATYKLSDFINY